MDATPQPTPKKKRPKIRDYTEMRREYVEGTPGEGGITWLELEAIALKHKINWSQLRRRCAKEGWVKQREKFREDIVMKAREARAEKLAALSLKLDDKVLGNVDTAIEAITQMLTNHAAAVETLKRSKLSKAEMQRAVSQRLDPKSLNALSFALQNLQRAGKVALGEPEERKLKVEGELRGSGPTIIVETYGIEEAKKET